MNNLSIIGRVGRDPELRYFESGSVVANFSVAVNRIGEDEPLWFDVSVWGKQAQVCSDWVKKGSQIGLQGEVGLKQYTSKQSAETVSKLTINVQRVTLIKGKDPTPAMKPATGSAPTFGDQEVPF